MFGRFHRVIRDLTRANGKDIRLAISGENTELDKRMIDELGDPMIHLIRNAADHGIESPEDRAATGKPRQGTISLSAFHRGSSIIIRVSDDGRGLRCRSHPREGRRERTPFGRRRPARRRRSRYISSSGCPA